MAASSRFSSLPAHHSADAVIRCVRHACAWSVASLLLACATAHAQVYTCVAEDGSRVFSDQRCGPDAKLVPGIGQSKAPARKPAGPAKPPPKKKSPDELEALIQRCDAGDTKACSEWTLGGGPNLLRETERKAELECEGGSLAACEERYCREGLDADCRARVLRTAKLAGETWYLHEETAGAADGSTEYSVRCIPEGATAPRDLTITCASDAGPNRCRATDTNRGFPRLAAAATQHCAAP